MQSIINESVNYHVSFLILSGPSSSPGVTGPLCFDCQNFEDPAMCDRVTLCSADEVITDQSFSFQKHDHAI